MNRRITIKKPIKMKKILFSIFTLAITTGAIAQEAADKKFQAGLVFGAGMNFSKMETNRFASDGAGSDWTIGANGIYAFTETIALCTGVEFDFETTKFKEGEVPIYYHYDDKTILKSAGSITTGQLYRLNERRQKSVYLSIPLMAQFRTNYIGYFRYFGKFGLRSSIPLTTKINDQGTVIVDNNITNLDPTNYVSRENTNMTTDGKELFAIKSSVGIAGGAEWNFTGSTCLVAEIGYYYGFTPLYWSKPEFYYTTELNNGVGNDKTFSNEVKQSQLQFKVSILF